MHIITGIVVSVSLLCLLYLKAYSAEEGEQAEKMVDSLAAILSGCAVIGCLLVGYWVAAVFGKF